MEKISIKILLVFVLGVTSLLEASGRGIKVSKIKSLSLSNAEMSEVAQLLRIQIGKPLNLEHIDSEIKQLFLSGRFGDVRVFLEKEKNGKFTCVIEGVKLKKLGAVDWSHVDEKLRAQIGAEKILVEGQRIDSFQIKAIAVKIRDALEERGYIDPKVTYDLIPVPDESLSDIRFNVSHEGRTTIREIKFRGSDNELKQSLSLHLKIREGEFFDKELIDKSSEAMTKFLLVNQYPSANIKWSVENRDNESKQCDLVFDVLVGQRYRFLFKGNEVFDSSLLRSLITFDILGQSDSSNKIKKIIRDKYRATGFHFVDVDVDVGALSREGLITINIQITEGPKVLVDTVVFDGLTTDKAGNLSQLFFANAVGVLRRKVFWEEGIEESTARFVQSLRERGFLSASVTGPRMFFSDDRRGVQLFYDLRIGNLFEIRKISFTGNQNVSSEVLQSVVPFKVGETLNRDTLKSAVELVRGKVQSAGFLDAQVRSEELSEDLGTGSKVEGVEVRFRIEEGSRYHVGSVKVEGLSKTQEKVVRREIVISSGEAFDPEKVRQSEENISLLGIFSRVEALTSSSPDEPRIKNIVFVLSEIKPGFGEVGLGALYEDPLFRMRTFLGVGYRNLFGLNQTTSLRSEVSLPISRSNVLIPFVEYAALVNYRAPYFADLPFAFAVQGGFTSFQVASSADGRQSDLQTKARVEERIEKRLTRKLMAQYRVHRLERTRTEVIERRDSGGTQTLSDTIDVIGSTGPVLTLDLRNDVFNPSSGSLHSLDIEFAHPNLLSNQELAFLLALQRNSFYFPISKDLNFAIYVGFGWAKALMERALPEARLANELALGGQGSIRGYAPRLFRAPAGVREIAFYNVRSELAVPLFGEVSGAVFFDTGQLFPDLKSDSRNDGVGLGIRYKTPVGPIVLDLAHGLSPAAQSMVRFTFTVGTL